MHVRACVSAPPAGQGALFPRQAGRTVNAQPPRVASAVSPRPYALDVSTSCASCAFPLICLGSCLRCVGASLEREHASAQTATGTCQKKDTPRTRGTCQCHTHFRYRRSTIHHRSALGSTSTSGVLVFDLGQLEAFFCWSQRPS